MPLFPDYTPVYNSKGKRILWLGIDKGAKWTHSGQPLTFTNWKDSIHANNDQHSSIGSKTWIWYNAYVSSVQCAFICEKDI